MSRVVKLSGYSVFAAADHGGKKEMMHDDEPSIMAKTLNFG